VSQAARSWSNWTISAFVVLVLAGCGGTWHATFEEHGIGKDEYWVVHAKGKPKAVVVFLHGLGQDSGEQLEPWQAHLASRGYDVIYPRYEDPPPDPKITPKRRFFSRGREAVSMPAVRKASVAAASASGKTRETCFRSRFSTQANSSKSGTSPAICT